MSEIYNLIKGHFGEDFPLTAGCGKRDDPFVISELVDYVGVEYALASHVMSMLGEEFALSEQRLHTSDERVVDELIFDVKDAGEADWIGIRRFFFDITAGFRRSGG